MNVLILSANTGGGHNSAANAIREELNARGVRVEIADCLAFFSEAVSNLICWGYSYICRNMPRLFGKAYEYEEKHSTQPLYDTIKLGAEKCYRYLCKGDYDRVICTHAFAGIMMTEVIDRYGEVIPFSFVATDYTCSPSVNMIKAEVTFIPDESLRQEFVSCGVPAERIVVSGIPVRRTFLHSLDKTKARQMLNLPEQGRIALIFSGSIGCGKMDQIADALEKQLPSDVTSVIICGHNEQVYRTLSEQDLTKTVVVGYTDQMDAYMAAADVCLCKPGGLSSTELLMMKLPALFLLTVPGCESRNYNFFLSRQLAVGALNWDDAIRGLTDLLSVPGRLEGLQERLNAYCIPFGPEVVADWVTSEQPDRS